MQVEQVLGFLCPLDLQCSIVIELCPTGEAWLQNCIGSWVGGINTFNAGTQITFKVLMKDMFGNILNLGNGASDFLTLTMSVLDESSSKVIPYSNSSVSTDKAIGYQYLSFEMQILGQFLLQVVFGTRTLMGSPFPFTVVTGKVMLPRPVVDSIDILFFCSYLCRILYYVGRPMVAKCTGSWLNQVNTFQAGYSIATLNVQLKDAFGNVINSADGDIPLFLFTVGVVGQSNTMDVLSNLTQLPGQQITFVPLMAGSFQLRVGSKDSIVGSPFSFKVNPGTKHFVLLTMRMAATTVVILTFVASAGPLSIPSCIAAWINNTNTFTSGQQANLSLQLMDAAKNTLSTFTGRLDNLHVATNLNVLDALKDVEVSDARSGYIYISFTTSTAAKDILLKVGTIVGGSWQSQASNSPLLFHVQPGAGVGRLKDGVTGCF